MYLFNTLTGRKEFFTAGNQVRLYVCGITPYDTTHLGHARTYVVFDVLLRHLSHKGHDVRYVQNVTDVDESILQRAAESSVGYEDLGERFTRDYFEDMAALGVLPADVYPRATATIAKMQKNIERLLDSGNAYMVEGNVYYRVESIGSYGELSRRSREEMLDAARREDASTVDDPRKEDPLDFPLWRASEDGVAWSSPWGRGRPGWHIECSTMALEQLGPQIDIHGGGADLIYPHHESEIAQSEAITGVRPFARFWVHVGMVRFGGKDMSKSLGNMVFARDVLTKYTPDAVRLYLLKRHYRSPVDFDERELVSSERLASRLARAARAPSTAGGTEGFDAAEPRGRFLAALDDDLDTPRAIDALRDLDKAIGRARDTGFAVGRAQRALRQMAPLLGLELTLPVALGGGAP
jgi:cysteinyl-tRNA synthetase